MENEIRKQIPIVYLNIWDNFPSPYYNGTAYASCDLLMAISKQTKLINKLVLDNEICGMAYRLIQGIGFREEALALNLLQEVTSEKHFLTSPHTLKWFKKEAFFPSEVIDRSNLGDWEKSGKKTAGERAKEKVKKILSTHQPKPLPPEIVAELTKIIQSQAKLHNLDQLSA
jgi:trimethylamine--corrinoid protein Co-methyltransferase